MRRGLQGAVSSGLDEIAPFIAKIRIAKGVSQTELARRLGIRKQVISRYEETDYQTVAIGRLQEILDAIGISHWSMRPHNRPRMNPLHDR